MKRAIALFALFALVALGACSGDSSEGEPNNGWELGDDAGNNASNNASDAGNNGANNTASANNTTSNNPNPNNTSANNPTTNNTSSTTNANNTIGPATNNNTMGNGTGVEGDPCTVNSVCGADLVCCQGFDGNATCQPQCFGGGLCGGSDAECAGDEVCCDLSGINQPDSCTRPNFCQNNNNMGTPCQNNTECQAPEVCCLGFDGQGECTTDCFTGGACEADGDCLNGQLCCDFNVAKVCLDQCSF